MYSVSVSITKCTGNCQSQFSKVSSFGAHPLKAAPHLSYGYSPLLPRPKHVRLLEKRKVLEKSDSKSLTRSWINPAIAGGENVKNYTCSYNNYVL